MSRCDRAFWQRLCAAVMGAEGNWARCGHDGARQPGRDCVPCEWL